MKQHPSTLEFSRTFKLVDAAHTACEVTLAAGNEEKAALAKRFQLLALDQLEATVRISSDAMGYVVRGHLKAKAIQACAVTLQSAPEDIDTPFETLFVTPEQAAIFDEMDAQGEVVPEDYDEYVGGTIDLGELVAQMLAVNLDPYPRAKGAGEVAEKLKMQASPFAILSNLKEKG